MGGWVGSTLIAGLQLSHCSKRIQSSGLPARPALRQLRLLLLLLLRLAFDTVHSVRVNRGSGLQAQRYSLDPHGHYDICLLLLASVAPRRLVCEVKNLGYKCSNLPAGPATTTTGWPPQWCQTAPRTRTTTTTAPAAGASLPAPSGLPDEPYAAGTSPQHPPSPASRDTLGGMNNPT